MSLILPYARKLRHALFGALLLAAGCGYIPDSAIASCQPANKSLEQTAGGWRAVNGSALLSVESYRIVAKTQRGLTILPLRAVRQGEILIVEEARRRAMPFVLTDGKLLTALEPGAEPELFRRLPKRPQDMAFEPLELGRMSPLDNGRVQRIQKQLEERMQRDQAVLRKKVKHTETPGEVEKVTKENTAYLLELVRDVGWIDRDRFGLETAHRAVILTQHSGHVPLALAALPHVEKDFKGAHDSPETYPVFLDWLRLTLGDCQRYGSRIELTEDGAPVLAPLENPKKIEQIRAEQGMSTLDQYLDLASKYLFGGQEIQRPGP